MERYEHTILGLWLFGAGYAIHYVLYPVWRKHGLPSWSFIPLGILAWLLCAGLLLPFKDFIAGIIGFIEHPSMAFAFEVMVFIALFLLMGLAYQNSDIVMADRIRPFLTDSLFFRHSKRVRDDIFGQEEQKRIEDLALSQRDKAALKESTRRGRVPMDRAKEMHELEVLRKRRELDVGKDELTALRAGMPSDITDICKLFHTDTAPHPSFKRIFRLTIDPASEVCRSCVVFDQRTAEHVREPIPWFRFRQDLFDHAEILFSMEWMDRFRSHYSTFEIECYQEETDSFGLPRKLAFLRVGIPVAVLEEYRNRMFIATELEKVSTMTWLQGETQ